MREKLKNIGKEERHKFTAQFERFGSKRGYKGHDMTTVLLIDVRDSNENLVADHLWFNLTKGFAKLKLSPGDRICFMGRVEEYERGYYGYRDDVYVPYSLDYKISRPTKIEKL